MMVMDQPFTTASPILANYNWQDIASGIGYVYFYAVGLSSGKILTTQQITAGDDAYDGYTYPSYPNASFITIKHSEGGSTKTFYLAPFNTTKVIEGECIITYSLGSSSNQGGNGLNFKFYKNDTLILSEGVAVPNANEGKNYNAKATIPRTSFAKGDQLKIVAEKTFDGEWYDDHGMYLYHDPSDSETTIGNTPSHVILKFAIPFRIDL